MFLLEITFSLDDLSQFSRVLLLIGLSYFFFARLSVLLSCYHISLYVSLPCHTAVVQRLTRPPALPHCFYMSFLSLTHLSFLLHWAPASCAHSRRTHTTLKVCVCAFVYLSVWCSWGCSNQAHRSNSMQHIRSHSEVINTDGRRNDLWFKAIQHQMHQPWETTLKLLIPAL